jgi:hypothetical protein
LVDDNSVVYFGPGPPTQVPTHAPIAGSDRLPLASAVYRPSDGLDRPVRSDAVVGQPSRARN